MEEPDQGTCWLCERPLGRRVEWHHPVPKSRGGRVTEPLHPICHRTLHVTFTNAELARFGADRSRLREHAAIARFLKWIAKKPPDFHAPSAARRR
ncbi:HNH endonuclease [Novosphingobium sp. PC22D]|uniref:HNH endonuclease n=1 Tax=Novosphingobium sp. PC22D TaxID=1962403 RepID=UPI000BEFD5D8|nr:HNH endonuclease [Novosphingobium sp. PC22D]PEQ13452.1 HNH endonuclease [Novosphingobium sp. PC22D]